MMRSLVVFLFLSLLLWGNLPALADEGKTSTTTKTETEEGTDESKIHLDVVFSRPHTRSLPLVSPEAILSGSCICVTFEEAVPSAVVYIVKAGSGDMPCPMPTQQRWILTFPLIHRGRTNFGLKRRRLPIKVRFRCESNNCNMNQGERRHPAIFICWRK